MWEEYTNQINVFNVKKNQAMGETESYDND